MPETRACVFFDRDGVINRPILANGRSYAPRSVADFELMPGAAKAVRRVRKEGFLAIVVTNQKDVGRGVTAQKTLDEMHDLMSAAIYLDDIRVCTCVDDCPCYKPRPGMIDDAVREWNIDRKRSVIIGDTWRDVGAGRAAGLATILIDWGYDDQFKEQPDHVVSDIEEAVTVAISIAKPAYAQG